MARTLRMRRSQTGTSGMLLVLLGLWGGLIPFIGPYFHYAYTPDKAWDYTTARLWLEILPGAAVFLGGVLLVSAKSRAAAAFGAALAAAAGAWFTLGTVLSPLWNHGVALGGTPVGATVALRTAEQLGFFTGLGVVVVALAALAFGHATAWPAIVGYRRDRIDDDADEEVTRPLVS
jgi:peptidoglycan/LPS O-acetylase OafA/YrhL